MPEPREWMARTRGTASQLSGGFFIRRVSSPAAATAQVAGHGRQHVFRVTDNKENIPPPWAVAARRRARGRKSPLPSWYPRTPLRDITAIVNAVERRRRTRAAAIQQSIQGPEASLQSGNVTTSLTEEVGGSSQTPPVPVGSSDTSDASSNPTTASLTPSPIECKKQSCSSSPSSLSHADHSPQTPSTSTKPAASEEKLCSSIDDIERMVMKNLKRTRKASSKTTVQKSTLMSMR
ncbi:uncharacterized protein [Typha latifolia]|uniref:uncharacterized protein n=1 Tax=Typha latifolia TaxID=4733 RepID=UPI003C30AEC7